MPLQSFHCLSFTVGKHFEAFTISVPAGFFLCYFLNYSDVFMLCFYSKKNKFYVISVEYITKSLSGKVQSQQQQTKNSGNLENMYECVCVCV